MLGSTLKYLSLLLNVLEPIVVLISSLTVMAQSASTLERIEVAEKLATRTTHSRTASVNAIYLKSFAMASKFENTTVVLGKDGIHLKQARRELFNLIKGDLDEVIYMPLETDDDDEGSSFDS